MKIDNAVTGSFVLHSFAALIVAPVIVFVLEITAILIFNNSSEINSVLNAWGVGNPFLWIPGLLLGLIVNRFFLNRAASWVWLAGMAWIVCGVLLALRNYNS